MSCLQSVSNGRANKPIQNSRCVVFNEMGIVADLHICKNCVIETRASHWAELSSKYKFMLPLKSQSATECLPRPSFALSFCAYVYDCVCRRKPMGTEAIRCEVKTREMMSGNLGPKVKEWVPGGWLAPRRLHQSHLWRSMCSFMLLPGGKKMWFAGLWPEKSLQAARKFLSP